jgi:TetR/AcrR family transcriptional regulator, transcriptional repressor for nem operon
VIHNSNIKAARRSVAVGYGRWETAIRSCLQAMRDRGQLVPSADPGQLATAVLAALQGGLLLAQIERSVRPLATALDAMIAHIGWLATQPRASGHGGS